MTEELDEYFYARDHDRGAGEWCVRGPDGFKMFRPNLSKQDAYAIGKILSGKYDDAVKMISYKPDLSFMMTHALERKSNE